MLTEFAYALQCFAFIVAVGLARRLGAVRCGHNLVVLHHGCMYVEGFANRLETRRQVDIEEYMLVTADFNVCRMHPLSVWKGVAVISKMGQGDFRWHRCTKPSYAVLGGTWFRRDKSESGGVGEVTGHYDLNAL